MKKNICACTCIIALAMTFSCSMETKAQTVEERLAALEKKLDKETQKSEYLPKLHGILLSAIRIPLS